MKIIVSIRYISGYKLYAKFMSVYIIKDDTKRNERKKYSKKVFKLILVGLTALLYSQDVFEGYTLFTPGGGGGGSATTYLKDNNLNTFFTIFFLSLRFVTSLIKHTVINLRY